MQKGLAFRVLGPLEVLREGRPLRLGGERQAEPADRCPNAFITCSFQWS